MFVPVVIVGALGLLHDSWPKQSQAFWINIHALIGISLWLVLIARVGYRLRHVPPALPDEIGAFSLHALAALWHRLVLHDGVLARMLPRAETRP
jgi:cytochrome b561